MIRGIFILLFSIYIQTINAQNHVVWQVAWDEEHHEIQLVGKIDTTWHLYSPKTDPNLGPIPLVVTFQKSKDFKRKGDLIFLTEPTAHQDENFGGMVYIWEGQLELRQAIKVKRATAVNLTLNYMICDETKCIPPIDVPITIRIK